MEDAKSRCREALARVRKLLENEKHRQSIEQHSTIAMNAIAEYHAAVNDYLDASRVNLRKAEK